MAKPGRNDSCPCGSQKKYKKCCEGKAGFIASSTSDCVDMGEPRHSGEDCFFTLFNAGRLTELERRNRLILEHRPDVGPAWKLLSHLLVKQGKDGRYAMQKVANLSLGDSIGGQHMGVADAVSLCEDDADECEGHPSVTKVDDAASFACMNLTISEFQQLDQAELAYRKDLKTEPGHEVSHMQKGIALREQGRDREAAYHFQLAFSERMGAQQGGNHEMSSGLVHALIELTNKCNFHCDFCPSDSQRRRLEFISIDVIRQVFDEIAEKRLVQQVSLHLMGEPTLHPHLLETLDYASSRNIKTELVTNGSMLNAKTVPKILDSLYGLFVVSLQTPSRETFKHRGDAGLSWDRYIAGIRLLVREYLMRRAFGTACQSTLVLRVMVTNNSKLPSAIIESWDDVGQVMREWSGFVASVEAELGMTPFGRNEISPKTFETMSKQGDINYVLQQDISLCFWQGFTFANSMLSPDFALESSPSTKFCIHPFVDVGVLSNGDVTLCCLDYDGELTVGNVKDGTIESILEGKPTMNLRAAMLGNHPLPGFCQRCQSRVVHSPK